MKQYTITLTNGKTFRAERPWHACITEPTSVYVFRNVQGQDAPTMSPRDRLRVPRESILYVVQKGGDALR